MANAAEIFSIMSKAVGEVGPSLVPKVKGVIKFEVTGAGIWLVDLKNGSGKVFSATNDDKADITITISESDFISLVQNKLNPQQAFMKGLVKVKGNMGLAMKLNVVTAATRDFIKKNSSTGSVSPLPKPLPKDSGPASLKSAEIFRLIGAAVDKDGAELSKKVNGIFQFNITPGGAWNLDLKSSTPTLTQGEKKSDVTITVSDDDFVAISQGKLNSQQAFMKGKLKLKGNLALGTKLSVVFNAVKPTSKL